MIIGIISGVLWGLNDVFANIYSSHLDSGSTTLIVLVFALLLSFMQDSFSCLSIFVFHSVKKSFTTNLKQTKKTFLPLCLAAICAGPLGMVAGIVGIAYAGPVYAGVVTSCYPVVALLLAVIFLRERPTYLKMLGIVLSVVAVVCISIAGEESGVANITVGLIFASCAMLGWGAESILFSIAAKKSTQHISWLLAVRQLCSATSYLIVLLFIVCFYSDTVVSMLKNFIIFPLLSACLITAATSYLTYYHAIKKIGASLATTFNASFIFWAGVFSVVFNIATLQLSFVAWACVLILGIYFASSGTFSINKKMA